MNASVIIKEFKGTVRDEKLDSLRNKNLSDEYRKLRTYLIHCLEHFDRKFYKETAKTHGRSTGTVLRNIARRDFSTVLGIGGDLHDFDEELEDYMKNESKSKQNPFFDVFENDIIYSPYATLAYKIDTKTGQILPKTIKKTNISKELLISNTLIRLVELLNKRNLEKLLVMELGNLNNLSSEERYRKTINLFLDSNGLPILGQNKPYQSVDLVGLLAYKTKEADMEKNTDMGMKFDGDYVKSTYNSYSQEGLKKMCDKIGKDKIPKNKFEFELLMRDLFNFFQVRNCGRILEFGEKFHYKAKIFDFYSTMINPDKDDKRFERVYNFSRKIVLNQRE